MPTIIEELQERVVEIKAALDKAKAATIEAQAKQTSLEEQLEAYTNTLNFEERRSGASGPAKTFVPITRAEADTAITEATLINKSAELKRVLKERKGGIEPLDLHSELKKRGVEIGTNYVYAMLYRLKQSGEIRKKGRKFYWVESEETKPAS